METYTILQTGFSPGNSNFQATELAYFYRKDTADMVSLSNFMLYNDLPIINIVQEKIKLNLINLFNEGSNIGYLY
jgi:hypothetical protein